MGGRRSEKLNKIYDLSTWRDEKEQKKCEK
jgi:hypothetical protein